MLTSSYVLQGVVTILTGGRMELQDAISGFLIAKKQERVSAHTRHLYGYVLQNLTGHVGCQKLIGEITPQHIREHLVKLEETKTHKGRAPSPATIDIHYRNLKTFFIWLTNEQMLTANPMKAVKRGKGEKRLPCVLTESQVTRLLDNVRKDHDRNAFRDYCIVAFFLATGVRLEELTNLKLEDVNLDGGYVKVFGKGRKERMVPILDPNLISDLWRYLHRFRKARFEQERKFFLNQYGVGLEREGVKNMVRRALFDYLGDEVSKHGTHLLRHTFATMYIRYRCGDLERLRLIMGWTDIKMALVYVHLAGNDLVSQDGSAGLLDQIRRKG